MNEDSIKNDILAKIKNDEVKMTPKQFFVMKWFTLFVTSIFFLGLSFYIFAYITFLFVDNGLIYMPLLSQTGMVNFIVEVPWTLVFIGLAAVFLFSITSKTFYRIYRKPFLTFFFTIFIIIMLSHIIFVESGGMEYLKAKAYEENIKLVPSRLLDFRDSQTGTLFVGYVVSTTTDSVIIRDRHNNFVELFPENNIDLNTFSVGQLINAYGQRQDGKVSVKSIEIVR
jgi:hypothetical protein